MSSESLGAVGASTPYMEQRTPEALPAKKPEAATSSTSSQESAAPREPLSPTEASEVLADEAMQKVQQDQKEVADLNADELKDVLDEVNNLLYSMNRALRFEVHEKTEDLVVRVVNTKTDEVIRQYPREEVIERREKLLQGELGAFSTRID